MSEAREQTCASCGHASPPDARFCRECGAILTKPGAESARPTDSSGATPPSGESPEPAARAGRRGRWIAALVGIVVLAWLIHRHRQAGSEIPVPGVASPPPTAAVVSTPAPPSPTAPPARREPQNRAAREQAEEPTPPPPAKAEAEEGRRTLHPGWYRMRFRAPLFREPSETAPVVTYLQEGTRIRVTRVVPGFLAVESVTGKAPGYVSADDASPE